MRFIHLPLIRFITNHLIYYPTPANLNYLWSFGVLAALFLIIQLISGILLARHYTPHTIFAFLSVEHIIRDINYGWLLRYIHSNGASFFFIIIFIHILKNIYYKSFFHPRLLVWLTGVILFFLLMATAFLGYVLPWGQISFWGATVITNFFTAIPVIGLDIAQWLWGGYAISNVTLNRFFSLHYLLPFIISALAILHSIFLHQHGSNNPLGVNTDIDIITFYPYYYLKDFFLVLVCLAVFFYIVCFFPNNLGHVDNYIIANSLITPTHIVPEWYFLLFYAILRAIPNKLGGVVARFGAILILIYLILRLQFLYNSITRRNSTFQLLFQICFSSLIMILIILTWLGAQPIEYPFTNISLISINYYFFILIIGIITSLKLESYFIYHIND